MAKFHAGNSKTCELIISTKDCGIDNSKIGLYFRTGRETQKLCDFNRDRREWGSLKQEFVERIKKLLQKEFGGM